MRLANNAVVLLAYIEDWLMYAVAMYMAANTGAEDFSATTT
jgi:hypothetical protein